MFWELTLAEVSLVLKGRAKALKRERNDMIWQAWHIEAFSRQKKLPALKGLLADNDEKTAQKRMSAQQIQDTMKGVFAARVQTR